MNEWGDLVLYFFQCFLILLNECVSFVMIKSVLETKPIYFFTQHQFLTSYISFRAYVCVIYMYGHMWRSEDNPQKLLFLLLWDPEIKLGFRAFAHQQLLPVSHLTGPLLVLKFALQKSFHQPLHFDILIHFMCGHFQWVTETFSSFKYFVFMYVWGICSWVYMV